MTFSLHIGKGKRTYLTFKGWPFFGPLLPTFDWAYSLIFVTNRLRVLFLLVQFKPWFDGEKRGMLTNRGSV